MTTIDPGGPQLPPRSLLALAIVAILGIVIGFAIQEWRLNAPAQGTASQLERAKDAIQEDNEFAIRVFTKLARNNDPEAQYWLGYMTERGLGMPRNPAKAIELYKKAAARNIIAAEVRLGEIYLHGNLVPPDFSQAMTYLREPAYRGDPRAAMLLGRMYHFGLGVVANPVEAYAWLEVAVLEGSAYAQRERDASLHALSTKDQKIAISRVKDILAEITDETIVPKTPPPSTS